MRLSLIDGGIADVRVPAPSRLGARARRYLCVPAAQVDQFFGRRELDPAGEIDCHHRGDVGDRERIAGDEFMRSEAGVERLKELRDPGPPTGSLRLAA